MRGVALLEEMFVEQSSGTPGQGDYLKREGTYMYGSSILASVENYASSIKTCDTIIMALVITSYISACVVLCK